MCLKAFSKGGFGILSWRCSMLRSTLLSEHALRESLGEEKPLAAIPDAVLQKVSFYQGAIKFRESDFAMLGRTSEDLREFVFDVGRREEFTHGTRSSFDTRP